MDFICKDCFADRELQGYILSQGEIRNCDSCETKNIKAIPLVELLDFFEELLDNFQIRPDNGNAIKTLINDNWNLFANELVAEKILNYILSITGSHIENSEILVDFSDDILDNINHWFVLKQQLKNENRYFTNIIYLTEDLGWDGFFGSTVLLTKENVLYRARLHQNAEQAIYQSHQMSCPPSKFASAGRANPIGIPYLYLSDNKKTILYEVRATYLDELSVAEFSIKDDIDYPITISDFTEIPTLYHPNEVTKRIKLTLLRQLISQDLSKPMRRYDSELDYIPTQFICEFIKIFTNVHGIKFASSLHASGNNIVIFNQDIMECRTVKKMRVKKLTIKSEKINN